MKDGRRPPSIRGWRRGPDSGWRRQGNGFEAARQTLAEMARLRKKGADASPVVVDERRRAIAHTFWGQSWCRNLEAYSDFANRLPRGRTYVRTRRVVHLEIAPGKVEALVRGSSLYKVKVRVAAVPKLRWNALSADCSGEIDSLVELLQGRFSQRTMERICRQGEGLFPTPAEIHFSCSCPDWATMCKHVAAVLYGIGVRLDERPELLFALRRVDQKDLITRAGGGPSHAKGGPPTGRLLEGADLSALFGLDIASPEENAPASGRKRKEPKRRPDGKGSARKTQEE